MHPESLPERERTLLKRGNIKPFEAKDAEFDTVITKQVWSALRIAPKDGPDQSAQVISMISDQNLDKLEALVVMAIQNIQRGEPIKVTIASDLPRLSPAEAYEDYQKEKLLAPIGSDVYSEAKRLLKENNFQLADIHAQGSRRAPGYRCLNLDSAASSPEKNG